MIHSGSRNLGKQVAEIYQQLAIDLNKGKEISRAKREATMPEDLCYLYGTYFEDYMHDVEICQRFAKRNRKKIAEVLLRPIKVRKC